MTMHSDSELLTGLSAEAVSEINTLGVRVQLAPGAELFDIGSEARSLYLVERGRMNLTLPMQFEDTTENVLVEERQPGQLLGWSALIPPHRFTLRAVAPLETEVIAFSRDSLLAYFRSHPEVAYLVTRNVGSVIGHRLQVVQAMWLREVQRAVQRRFASVPE